MDILINALLYFYFQVGFVIDERLRVKKNKQKVAQCVNSVLKNSFSSPFLTCFLLMKYQFMSSGSGMLKRLLAE
jgi:hypothetical protein